MLILNWGFMGKKKKKKVEKSRVLFTRITKIWLGEDGIGRVVFLPNIVITLGTAKEHFAACTKLSKGKSVPVFCDLRNIKYGKREARQYFASKEASKLTKASAILVSSSVSKVIGNFFVGINKPPYPVKFFASESEAMEWLKVFLE